MEQLDPRDPMAFREGSIPVFLKKHMAAFAEVCTLLGGCSVFVGLLLIVSYVTIINGGGGGGVVTHYIFFIS